MLDLIFGLTMGSFALAGFLFVIWIAYSFIKIERESR